MNCMESKNCFRLQKWFDSICTSRCDWQSTST